MVQFRTKAGLLKLLTTRMPRSLRHWESGVLSWTKLSSWKRNTLRLASFPSSLERASVQRSFSSHASYSFYSLKRVIINWVWECLFFFPLFFGWDTGAKAHGSAFSGNNEFLAVTFRVLQGLLHFFFQVYYYFPPLLGGWVGISFICNIFVHKFCPTLSREIIRAFLACKVWQNPSSSVLVLLKFKQICAYGEIGNACI